MSRSYKYACLLAMVLPLLWIGCHWDKLVDEKAKAEAIISDLQSEDDETRRDAAYGLLLDKPETAIKAIPYLLEMLKDDKNIEYQDQIYYALGELEMKDNKVSQAIEYYLLSAETSVSNTNQKALTFLALANIYFDKTEYIEAQAYFDSAVVSLDHDFPGYRELATKNQYLSKLVTNLNIVSHQDSLQMVANMSEPERDNFIKGVKSL